ncbi:type II DNA topoisomerase [Schizophyllum commune H4-8]|uniref:type II DNA topoisomerase n=1 Tax=Schizophyllum commune (strain H4-8 / FGSC 9210) TaxID=578458 RepID=UPI002160E889|nr:type II DNA topoisomerase [Schizophyllum commune H4-8]KAI5885142.1 type II DNA topoisomerase [Schizophyllum commune H4-8]
MSSDDGENFDLDDVSGSDSDGYAPAPKKKAAPKAKAPAKPRAPAKPKSTAAKPAAKGAAKGKKKVLAERDDNAEDESDIDVVMADPDEVNDADGVDPTSSKKNKSASETYQKLTQLEHILKRPDSYIGSVETIQQPMWTYDAEKKRMVHRTVKYVPGFFKIVDEILVNAADNKINDPSMDTIKVSYDLDENTISVYNNGKGIPIEMHSREKMYIPELIFGHLLSSSNYDDDEKKLTGGRNGYGAKLANIYSHEFTVETADKNTKQKYKQTWTDNMSKCGKPKITSNGKGEEYTRVTFRPDLKRFGMDRIDEDTASLLQRRVYDLAGTVKDVKVFLNDERLKIKNFKQYVEMYINSAQAEASEVSGGAAQTKPTIVHEILGKRWEVAFTVSEGTFQQVSFANSIATIKGGTHVNLIADQIAKNLLASINKKNKAATVKAPQIKNHMWIFVNALIENPTFDSQTKETLTLPASKFGTKPVLSEDFMKKVQKSPLVENILNWAKFKADQQIKKTDGSKRSRLTGLPKLSDANNAGTKYAKDCTLILTEGDSAKALAIAGLGVVGRDNYGVFPLRGKLLNVREARHDQIMKNEEIQNIKKILGLQHNKDYTDIASLRYGKLMIMTDQDHDGSHIKGLILNFLDHFYPSLLKLDPAFLLEFITPIVRVTKGNQRKDFFTLPEYERWLETTPDARKWSAKYYKGLGTSKDSDARDYFSHTEKHVIPFAQTQEGDRELIDLAFSKKKADDRKEWLRTCKPGTFLNHDVDEIPISDFINKELILFSMADNIRSIPSVADGLKPGQRKIIWGCFKRKLKKEIKVAQLVGYVSEHAAYHHGEQSLTMTIVNLAQDYVGSNNINLLMPNGQYGTRDQGGKDHAAARYIFTELSPLTRSLFNTADEPLLKQQKEDNQPVEPEYYMPIIPMVLVNGADGIGTGWSTSIPSYNPTDIVANIRRLMDGEEQVPMFPWWRGFNGEIKSTGKNKYDVTGIARKLNDTQVEITELPIHKWTQNFKAELETMMVSEKGEAPVKTYTEHHDNTNVHFIITMSATELKKAEEQGFVEYFKLTSKISTANMIAFNFDGKITKYDSPEEIVEEFYPQRLMYYQKRKDYLADELQVQLSRLNNQARFIQMIVDRQLIVSNRKKVDIVADLRKHDFRPFPKIAKAKEAGEDEPTVEQEEEEEEDIDDDKNAYDYLLNMAIHSLTREKIERLRKQSQDKEEELNTLLAKSPKQMWNEDLDDFLVQWDASLREWDAKKEVDSSGKKVKRGKNKPLLTRKSIGEKRGRKDDSDDDDFKPTKAAPKKRAAPQSKAAGTSKPKAAVKKEESDDDDDAPAKPPPKRAPAKKVIKDDSDDDFDVVPAPKAAAAAKKKAPAKRKSSDDSDVEMPPPKKAPQRRAPAKKKVVDSDDDDDSDVEVLPASNGKGKAKAPPKRKSLDRDSDGEDDEAPPAKKKAQTSMTDFLTKPGASKPAAAQRKVSKPTAKPPSKAKKVIESDDDDELDMSFDTLPAPPPRAAPPRRGAAAAAAAKKYVDISDDEDDD